MDCGDDKCNPWKKGNLNRFPVFGFGNLDEIYERMFNELEQSLGDDKDSLVWGFSIKVGPDGKPQIKEFGNRPDFMGREDTAEGTTPTETEELGNVRKPLIDVIEDDQHVTIIAEMPGVDKEDIDVSASGSTVEITAEGEDRKYHETLELDCKVVSDSATAKYNNGVLEIVFSREQQKEKKTINIE